MDNLDWEEEFFDSIIISNPSRPSRKAKGKRRAAHRVNPPPPTFPPEIFEHIIDVAAQSGYIDDSKGIIDPVPNRSLSLVSRSFCRRVYHNVYQHVSLEKAEDQPFQQARRTFVKLANILRTGAKFTESKISLLFYIRVLEFEERYWNRVTAGDDFILNANILIDIMRALDSPHTSLETLIVKFPEGTSWNSFGRSWRTAFTSLCHSKIKTLQLKHLDNLPLSFMQSSSFATIILRAVSFSVPSSEGAIPIHSAIHDRMSSLKKLDFELTVHHPSPLAYFFPADLSRTSSQWPVLLGLFSNLECLSLSVLDRQIFHHGVFVMHCCSYSLQSLCIRVQRKYYTLMDFPLSIPLDDLPSLRHLQLIHERCVMPKFISDDILSLLSASNTRLSLNDILPTLQQTEKAPGRLEHLIIGFPIQTHVTPESWLQYPTELLVDLMPSYIWDSVDRVLGREPSFSTLHTLEFTLLCDIATLEETAKASFDDAAFGEAALNFAHNAFPLTFAKFPDSVVKVYPVVARDFKKST